MREVEEILRGEKRLASGERGKGNGKAKAHGSNVDDLGDRGIEMSKEMMKGPKSLLGVPQSLEKRKEEREVRSAKSETRRDRAKLTCEYSFPSLLPTMIQSALSTRDAIFPPSRRAISINARTN